MKNFIKRQFATRHYACKVCNNLINKVYRVDQEGKFFYAWACGKDALHTFPDAKGIKLNFKNKITIADIFYHLILRKRLFSV